MSFQEYSESMKGRLHLGNVNVKALAGGIAILLAAVAIVLFNVFGSAASSELTIEKAEAEEAQTAEDIAPAAKTICVHIGGCVAHPGVVYLNEGSRVADGIDAAGGVTEEASTESVNLARALQDGEQVIVPSKAEAQAQAAQPSAASATGSASAGAASSATSGKVNINSASLAELMTLSGIGESKANKIIDYRESSGPFKSVDELTKVSGIGDKTIESIRDSICV